MTKPTNTLSCKLNKHEHYGKKFHPSYFFLWFTASVYMLITVSRNNAETFPSGSGVKMQETRVWSLVREDPTCCGVTTPMWNSVEPVLSSPGATASEPTWWRSLLRPGWPRAHAQRNKTRRCNRRAAHRSERAATTLHNYTKAQAAMQTQHSQKQISKEKETTPN